MVLNNPFTLFLRYSVDYIWSTMEQWRQFLCRFLYTYDFLWSPPLFLQLILYVYSELFIYSQNIPYFNWLNHTKWRNNKTSLALVRITKKLFLCRLIYVNLFPLCALFFLYLSFLSFSCVLSRFCLVFGFFLFLLINPLPCSLGILFDKSELNDQ
jgi:hypothetical protein